MYVRLVERLRLLCVSTAGKAANTWSASSWWPIATMLKKEDVRKPPCQVNMVREPAFWESENTGWLQKEKRQSPKVRILLNGHIVLLRWNLRQGKWRFVLRQRTETERATAQRVDLSTASNYNNRFMQGCLETFAVSHRNTNRLVSFQTAWFLSSEVT